MVNWLKDQTLKMEVLMQTHAEQSANLERASQALAGMQQLKLRNRELFKQNCRLRKRYEREQQKRQASEKAFNESSGGGKGGQAVFEGMKKDGKIPGGFDDALSSLADEDAIVKLKMTQFRMQQEWRVYELECKLHHLLSLYNQQQTWIQDNFRGSVSSIALARWKQWTSQICLDQLLPDAATGVPVKPKFKLNPVDNAKPPKEALKFPDSGNMSPKPLSPGRASPGPGSSGSPGSPGQAEDELGPQPGPAASPKEKREWQAKRDATFAKRVETRKTGELDALARLADNIDDGGEGCSPKEI